MKKLSLVLGLLAVLFAVGLTSAFADTACVQIRRVADNRVIAKRCNLAAPTQYTYPNDRVARGEAYKVENTYSTSDGGLCVYTYTGRTNPNAYGTGNFYDIHIFAGPGTSYSWQDTVPTNPALDNIYFDVRSYYGTATITSIKLPIGLH
jgi:hypothetical protein